MYKVIVKLECRQETGFPETGFLAVGGLSFPAYPVEETRFLVASLFLYKSTLIGQWALGQWAMGHDRIANPPRPSLNCN
jgi:hypothetical protein